MTNETVDLSLSAIFRLILRNSKFLIGLAVITIIASSIVSLLMTEYYRSTVIIFPARINSLSLNESSVRRGNISEFGDEEEAEQLLQIINSDGVQELVIKHNDLYRHYEVNKNEPHARTKIRQIYNKNVSAKRTKFNSIDISVIDIDPVKASAIANSVSEYTDTVMNRMIQRRARTSMAMVDEEFDRLSEELKGLNKEIDGMHSQGVVGLLERGSLYEAYGNALRNADSKTAGKLSDQMEVNRKHGDEYDYLARQRELVTDQLLRLRNLRNQFLGDANIAIPQKFVVDEAVPADKKAYPIRWLIVIGSLFSVLAFALILIILQENYRSIFKRA